MIHVLVTPIWLTSKSRDIVWLTLWRQITHAWFPISLTRFPISLTNASLWRQITHTWFPISLTPIWLTPLITRYRMTHSNSVLDIRPMTSNIAHAISVMTHATSLSHRTSLNAPLWRQPISDMTHALDILDMVWRQPMNHAIDILDITEIYLT